MHPEKALLVSREFAERRAENHHAMTLALAKACALCDTKEGRLLAAKVLAQHAYLDLDQKILEASLETDRPEFHLFHGQAVNCPASDKANWLVTEMRLAGMLDGLDRSALPPVTEIFRADLYERTVALPPTTNSVAAS